MSGSRRVRALVVAVSLVLVLAATGCGLQANDTPRDIAAADLPPDLGGPEPSSTIPATQSPTTAAVTIYYLVQQGGVTHLHGVSRNVADASRARDRLGALLAPPTAEEQAAGILTSIPATTILVDSQVVESDDELIVDLSRSLFDVQGQELRNAFAQIVWTATELDGVRRVRFLVDGEEFRAPDENGIEQPGAVTRSNYDTLRPA